MKLVTSSQMRALDERAIRECGIPGRVLMDRAGREVARCVRDLIDWRKDRHARVLLAAGKGNNGGDAFAAARYLTEWGIPCAVWLAGARSAAEADAAWHLERMDAARAPLLEKPAESDWDRADATGWTVAVDGLLGTGIKGDARGVAAAGIRCLNRLASTAVIVAVDVPSGLDADGGSGEGPAVEADVTVTMGLPKRGFVLGRGPACVGSVLVADIGIPDGLTETVDAAWELVTERDVRAWLPRRPRDSNKGTFGHALLVSGSSEYPGAAALAGSAAARSGAGLVTAWVPRSIAHTVAVGVPEIITQGVGKGGQGGVSGAPDGGVRGRPLDPFSAILAGPGLGASPYTRAVVEDLLDRCNVPLVLDADALNVQRLKEGLLTRARAPLILTPHPGEMARFLGLTVREVQADRIGLAERVANTTGATVVLKGSGTVVASPGHRPAINLTGNPGMAKGGCGDALAGLLAGLLAQGIAPFEAACASVYLHGRAGDRAAWRLSQTGMKTGDLIEQLPQVFRDVCAR